MDLEIILEWDEKTSFEEARGINVLITPRDADVTLGLKESYQGTIELPRTAENYACHVALTFSEDRVAKLVPDGESSSTLSFVFTRYGEETPGRKAITLSTDRVKEPERLSYILGQLEERKFIVARDEWVNACDYWAGFFGTSNNLWKGSTYARGTPAEKAIQLAHEVEQGKRTDDMPIWFFPGYIHVPESMRENSEAVEVVGDMNRILTSNSHLEHGVDPVVSGLRQCAERYQVVVTQ